MRLYRQLLRAFPASFRMEYGDEMGAIFARRRRDASGALQKLALWVEAIADVAVNAARAHGDLLRQDLRYTARTLRRAPGFAVTAILVAALGVGATTATFSITDHVLFRPLPFADPERLVKLWQDPSLRGKARMELSPANYRDWKRMSSSYEAMGAYSNTSVNLVGDGAPERLEGAAVTADLLPMLGVQPELGRLFDAADDREGAAGTALLSHRLWKARFGGDPGVLGRKVILNDAAYTIIGVMPRAFNFPSRNAELWTAKRFAETDFADRTDTYIYSVARLKRGVSVEQARAEIRLIAAQLERAYPKGTDRMGANVVGLRDEVSSQARSLLLALFGAALCVLLIACANLANLLLARGLFRRRELAVRTALGAGRERLLRQLVTESLALAVGGGLLGVGLAVMATPLVTRLAPNSLPIAAAPDIDLRVLAFAALTTLLTGVGFGVAPALRAGGDAAASGMREGARSIGGGRERLRSALVSAEVAATVVLLVSSGLLLRALARVQATDPGFRTDGVLTLRTALPLPKYEKTADRQRFYTQVLAEIGALPGVSQAAYISGLPMAMRGGIWKVEIDGRPPDQGDSNSVSLRFVTPGFFSALAIPLRSGRDVSASDTRESPFVAVVSESFVRRHWPAEDPIGHRFKVAFQDRLVVGVVGDVRVRGLERTSEPQIYLPSPQVPDNSLVYYVPKDLVVRSSTEAASLLPAIRRIVARADPEQPISDVRMLSDIVEAETAPRSVQVQVLGAFAAIAVLLAAIGIHGLLAFTVSNRSQEIGVRVALGAESRDILALVLREGALLAATGVLVGVALAYAAGRGMQALLAGVSPADAPTFLAVGALCLIVTLAGSLAPALRAVRLDPLTAIRTE
jgi:predicted permease